MSLVKEVLNKCKEVNESGSFNSDRIMDFYDDLAGSHRPLSREEEEWMRDVDKSMGKYTTLRNAPMSVMDGLLATRP